MKHITISEPYSLESQQLLKLKLNAQIQLTKSQDPQAKELKETQVLLTRSHTVIDERLLAMAPHLQVIGSATSGLNHIDKNLCQQKKIRVFNSKEANTQSAAEHTLMLILNLLKKLNEAQKSLKEAKWRNQLSRGAELHGKSLGVIGLGRVGTQVAQLAQAFGAEVSAYDPYVTQEHFERHHVTPLGFSEVLNQSDILTLHVPLTSETKNMINRKTLSLLNESSLLINTSRGEVLNENDLLQFLSLRQLGGAALDVYSKEPFAPSQQWLKTPNLLLSPHIGAFTEEAFQRASMDVAQQIIEFFTQAAMREDLPKDSP